MQALPQTGGAHPPPPAAAAARPAAAAPAPPPPPPAALPRRAALAAAPAAALAAALAAPRGARARAGAPRPDPSDWSSPGLAAPVDPAAPRFLAAPGGVRVQVLAEGAPGAPEAAPGDRVLVDYVLRRANGYFIYSTAEGVSFQPRDVPTGPVLLGPLGGDGSGVVPGLADALVGMRQGGKRRVLVPPGRGYGAGGATQPAMPTYATARQLGNHAAEPLLFEVQLLRVLKP